MGEKTKIRSEVDIHPTAVVHPQAQLGTGTTVGAFSVIGENVRVGQNCRIQEHVVIHGHTQLGNEVQVFPFAFLGGAPQHTRYAGEPTRLEIGNRVILREGVIVHIGTSFGNEVTVIQDDVFLMGHVHVAHDCYIGKSTIIANAVQLAGHVTIQHDVMVGGHSAIAQFCRVGQYCYIGGGSVLRQDLPPFLSGKGAHFGVQGINAVGLKRKGFGSENIRQLKEIYKIFYKKGLTVEQAKEVISDSLGVNDEAKVFLDFLTTSKTGFAR